MSKEMLAIMQNPKTQTYKDEGQGGIPEITQSMASAACSGMPDKWLHSVRLFIQDDRGSHNDVKNYLLSAAATCSVRYGWPKMKTGFLTLMVAMAIADYNNPKRFKTEEERAEALGFSRRTWFRTWKTPYADLINLLDMWTDCGMTHMRNKAG